MEVETNLLEGMVVGVVGLMQKGERGRVYRKAFVFVIYRRLERLPSCCVFARR
jgi:hypothetical protein